MEKQFTANADANWSQKKLKYHPLHPFMKLCVFTPTDDKHDYAVDIARHEANLADAIARVGEQNGMSNNDVLHALPLILRMLKSKSDWAK